MFVVIRLSILWIVYSISYEEMPSRHSPQENRVVLNNAFLSTTEFLNRNEVPSFRNEVPSLGNIEEIILARKDTIFGENLSHRSNTKRNRKNINARNSSNEKLEKRFSQ